jgi:hypothetical protein
VNVPVDGGPDHSIIIVVGCDCKGNCKCYGIDNGMFGGSDHIFKLPITQTDDGKPLPQKTIDEINSWLRQNALGCLGG